MAKKGRSDLHGTTDLLGDAVDLNARDSLLAKRFGFPPFSVLDARGGDWQERKRQWLAMGIKSEIGREIGLTYKIGLTYNPEAAAIDFYREKESTRKRVDARSYNIHDWIENNREGLGLQGAQHGEGTSIFDPVVCELAYKWFSPPDGQIIDPFAGGSVRGIVAAVLGRRYWGCDLRPAQIDANRVQWAEIDPQAAAESQIEWVCGDSTATVREAPEADLIFTCPPYGDLEVYSDDPRDLSQMDYHEFVAAFKRIILGAVARLRDNRFAVVVVGDFRDNRGRLRNFVADTVAAFREVGCDLYNEMILVTPVGSAAMRATKQFSASRKACKTHQNVLVFVKGDPRLATQACGPLFDEAAR